MFEPRSRVRERRPEPAKSQSPADSLPASARAVTAPHSLAALGTPNTAATVVQRRVLQSATSAKWYSDTDPSQLFDTQKEAEDFEASLELPRPITGGRPATLFTHTATPAGNLVSTRGIPQGPHPIGYAAVTDALLASRGRIKLEHVVSEQVIHPDEWRVRVAKQFGKDDIFDGKTEMSRRVLRAYRDYVVTYRELMRAMAGPSEHDPYDLIEELMQLGPFGTYKYHNPGKVTKKQLKGKGENRDLSDPKNIDKNAKFREADKYAEHTEDVMGLLDDDYAPSGDDGEQSGGESSDYEGDASDGEGDMSVSEEDEPDYRNVVVSGALHQYDPDEVPGDGDCFFASMHALGHGADIAALRGLASANGGAANIRTAGVWAGIPDITGVANGLNIRVRVIALALDGVTVTQDSTYGIGGPITVIAHIFGGHFTPLRPAPELLAAKMRSR